LGRAFFWLGLLAWAALGGGFGCSSTSSKPPPGCLDYVNQTSASPTLRVFNYAIPYYTVDARGVDWVGQVDDAVELQGAGSGCFVGGRSEGTWDPADPWALYHLRFGLAIKLTGMPVTVEGLHVLNTGDAVSLKHSVPCPNGSPTWLTVRHDHFEDIHDDTIESDGLCAAEIDDNLMERVYVPLAFRNRSTEPDQNGSANTVSVLDNLIRSQAFQNNYNGQTSHPGVWKWAHGGKGPKIVVRRNRFLAFDAPPTGTLFPFIDKVVGCESNVLLFAGSEAEWQQALLGGCDDDGDDGLCDGARLLALAGCYTVITKTDSQSEADFLAANWDPYVASWKAAHSADDE